MGSTLTHPVVDRAMQVLGRADNRLNRPEPTFRALGVSVGHSLYVVVLTVALFLHEVGTVAGFVSFMIFTMFSWVVVALICTAIAVATTYEFDAHEGAFVRSVVLLVLVISGTVLEVKYAIAADFHAMAIVAGVWLVAGVVVRQFLYPHNSE